MGSKLREEVQVGGRDLGIISNKSVINIPKRIKRDQSREQNLTNASM